MNMENFITGYPSREFQIRGELLKILGKEKYDAFFDSVTIVLKLADQVSHKFFHGIRRQIPPGLWHECLAYSVQL